jgi:hypothetical protein
VRAAALSLLVSFALIPLSAVGVFAEENNHSNNGNHYGQVAPRGAHPADQLQESGQHGNGPIAAPPAAPAPAAQPPAAQPIAAVLHAPMSTSASAVNTGAGANTAEGPALVLNPVVPQSGDVSIVRAVPQSDTERWWLLLILAATLAVLWSFATVQLTRAGLKRRTRQAAG